MKLGMRLIRGLGVAGLVLAGTVFGAAAVGVVTAGSAIAQTVGSIEVVGNRRVEASTIRSYFKAGPDGRLDAHAIDEGYKALYATGLFQDVRIGNVGGRLQVTVVENPVIN